MIALAVAALATAAAPARTWSEPAGYCRAVRTVDRPDRRYVGPKDTPWMRRPFYPEGDRAPDGRPWPVAWRCMNGEVKACAFGANAPCDSKAAVSRVPVADAREYCRENTDTPDIPAAATGHETIYAWSCRGGRAVAGKVVLPVDRRGYQKAYWRTASP